MILAFLIPFCIALLTGMGIGSGGLMTLWLTSGQGVGQLQAQGINLLFFALASAAALPFHFRRRKISGALLAWLIPAGVVGALLGSMLSRLLSPTLLRRLFGILMLFAGSATLLREAVAFFARKIAGKR